MNAADSANAAELITKGLSNLAPDSSFFLTGIIHLL